MWDPLLPVSSMRPSKPDCQRQLDAILASDEFSRTTRLGPLLQCLSNVWLKDDNDGFVDEQQIYLRCFKGHGLEADRRLGAGATIVSSNMGHLETRLKEYQLKAGPNSPVLVRLVRGPSKHYRIAFDVPGSIADRWYKQALLHLDRHEPYHLSKAEEYLGDALREQPTHAGALAAKVELSCFLAMQDQSEPGVVLLERAVHDAVEARKHIDRYPTYAGRIHAALGAVSDWRYDFAAGAVHFAKAVTLEHDRMRIYEPYFGHLIAVGRFQEAVRLATQRVDEIPDALSYRQLGMCLYVVGELGDAAKAIDQALAAEREMWLGHLTMTAIRLEQGRPEEALRHITQITDAVPDVWQGLRILCLASVGQRAAATQELQVLLDRSASGQYVQPFQLALAHTGLGNFEMSANFLVAACEDCDPLMTWLHRWPFLRTVREQCPLPVATAMSRFKFPSHATL
jgi:tetratricopeptide (TPR) repeat protein